MILTKALSPPNSLLMLLERKYAELPEDIEPKLINSTPCFISIGTFPVDDGDTTVTLTDDIDWENHNPDMSTKFKGTIETPGLTLQLFAVGWEEVFNVSVREPKTNVQILTNDDYVPDKICIMLK